MADQSKKRRAVLHAELQKVANRAYGAQYLREFLSDGVCPNAISRGVFCGVSKAPLWAAAAMSGRDALLELERAGCDFEKIDGAQDPVEFCMALSPDAGSWALERAVRLGEVAKTAKQKEAVWVSWGNWLVDAHKKTRSRAGDGQWPIDEPSEQNMKAAVESVKHFSKAVAGYAGQPSVGMLIKHLKSADWSLALALAMNMEGSLISKKDRLLASKSLGKSVQVKDMVTDLCRHADEFSGWTARELGKRLKAMGLVLSVADAVESGSWEALECALAEMGDQAFNPSVLSKWCSTSLLGRESEQGEGRDEFGEILLWRLSFWAYTELNNKEFESCIVAGAKALMKAGGSLTALGPDGECALDKAKEYRRRMDKASGKLIATNWAALATGAASRDPREALCSWIEVLGEREVLANQLGGNVVGAMEVKRL